MADLFLIIDDAGVIESASAPTCEAFGYAAAELPGQPSSLILEIREDPTELGVGEFIRECG